MTAPDPAYRYEPISVSDESTVVAEFVPEAAAATAYQSEVELETIFVRQLQDQAYEYLPITTEAGAHGLIQAYSRTNRILNSVKTYGNIVSFRDLEDATNDALALFGNKDASGIVLLKPYAEYYAEYRRIATELKALYPLGADIVGESAKKEFIALFGQVLRLRNILTAFDDFTGDELLTEREFQDYRSIYLNLHAEFRQVDDAEKESINDDVVFEIELVKQVEVNVDYILLLIEQWREARGNGSDVEMEAVTNITRAIDSSPSLRNKSDLTMAFVDSVKSPATPVRTRASSSRPSARRNSRRSSPRRTSSPRRPEPSSTTPSATAPSQREAPRSPASSRPSPARCRPRRQVANRDRQAARVLRTLLRVGLMAGIHNTPTRGCIGGRWKAEARNLGIAAIDGRRISDPPACQVGHDCAMATGGGWEMLR